MAEQFEDMAREELFTTLWMLRQDLEHVRTFVQDDQDREAKELLDRIIDDLQKLHGPGVP